MTRRTHRSVAAALLIGTVGLVAALGSASSAAFADDEDGIGLSVTVSPAPVDPSGATPQSGNGTGTVSGSGTGTGTGSGTGSAGNGSTTPSSSVAPAPSAAPVLGKGEVDLGGVLFISGVNTDYDWSLNPLGGTEETSIMVRNVSNSTFSSTVRFWADGPFGNRLSEVKGVKITDLKPGESRTVDARLGGIGQFTFIQVHATVTPPKIIDGAEVESLTRDQFVIVAPWAVLALLGLGGLGYAAYSLRQYVLRPSAPTQLAGAPA